MPLKGVRREVGVPDCVLQASSRKACATSVLSSADRKIQEPGNSMPYGFSEQPHLNNLTHGIWAEECPRQADARTRSGL